MKYQFFLKSYLILRKKISLNKGKPENSFNITKKQEFELITSYHFKNLTSPKPTWNSQWSLISPRNLKCKVIASLPTVEAYFNFSFEKKISQLNPVNLDMGI